MVYLTYLFQNNARVFKVIGLCYFTDSMSNINCRQSRCMDQYSPEVVEGTGLRELLADLDEVRAHACRADAECATEEVL